MFFDLLAGSFSVRNNGSRFAICEQQAKWVQNCETVFTVNGESCKV